MGKFGKAIGDEEDENNQQPVSASFDFEVAEERVGPKQVQGFVDDVRFVRVRCAHITSHKGK